MKLKVENNKKMNNKLRIILVVTFLFLFTIANYIQLRGSYLEYLELGSKYTSIFFTNLTYKYGIMGISFIFLYFIIYFTNRGIKKGLQPFLQKENKKIPKLPNKSIALVISAIVSIIVSQAFMQKIMLVKNGTAFGIEDSIFGLDISYYMFQKPMVETLTVYFVGLFIGLSIYMALYYVIVFNYYFDGVERQDAKRKLVYEKTNKKYIIYSYWNCNFNNIKCTKYYVWKNINC